MPRSPELYFLLLGAVKIGAIVGPLFEAFMEGAVKDRLENSEAKVIVTTPDLLERIPFAELPKLESVIIVGGEKEDAGGVRTIHFEEAFEQAAKELEIEWMDEKMDTCFITRQGPLVRQRCAPCSWRNGAARPDG